MNKTITYKYKKKLFSINVSNPYTEMLHICVNNIIFSCVSPSKFIAKPDAIIKRAIQRYLAEKAIGLI